jgi:AAA+ ATPase superfamily predicted ATPase
MDFLDRTQELARLRSGVETDEAWMCVLWGRRRVGKSRLLLEWQRETDGLYFVADQSAAPLQRSYFASAVGTRFAGFGDVTYPDWRSMLDRLASEAVSSSWTGPLVIDEFPYLVASDGSLPSVFQNWIDNAATAARLKVVLCGSSQRMMQGLVLDHSAPLYGRASESFALEPLPAGFIREGLRLKRPIDMVEAYTMWGGTPRYWELARPFGSDAESAVDALALDPMGPLHHEPDRLLLEETPPATALRPLLDVIGAGAHRMSEIAGRLGQPATSLSRPLARLQELGLVRRETPFGSRERSGKRAVYLIADPFVRLWSRVVAPHRSLLATARRTARVALWRRYRQSLVAESWEELCRRSVPWLDRVSPGIEWSPAKRYWKGNDPEFDVLAESIDGTHLIVGEVKWSEQPVTPSDVQRTIRSLRAKGLPADVAAGRREVTYVIFVPEQTRSALENEECVVITAREVMDALREAH